MRRLIAALGLLSFANLLLVQGSGACPLSGGLTDGSGSVSAPAGHDGHDGYVMAAAANEESLQHSPDSESSHAPRCLTMGPCALTVDVGSVVIVAGTSADAQRVVAGSDRPPPSLTTSPELPPPRA